MTKVGQWLPPCHQSNLTLSAALYSRNKRLSISDRDKVPSGERGYKWWVHFVRQHSISERCFSPTSGWRCTECMSGKRENWLTYSELCTKPPACATRGGARPGREAAAATQLPFKKSGDWIETLEAEQQSTSFSTSLHLLSLLFFFSPLSCIFISHRSKSGPENF